MTEFSSLLEQAKGGDDRACAQLFRLHGAVVFWVVRRFLGMGLRRHYDSLDLTQSVYADVLRELLRFEDRGEAAFRRWLRIKARDKVRMKLRKHRTPGGEWREHPLDGTDVAAADPGPGSQAAHAEDLARIRGTVSTLEPRHRWVLHLRVDRRLAHAEVATRMGLPSAGAAKKLYGRALDALRAAWQRA